FRSLQSDAPPFQATCLLAQRYAPSKEAVPTCLLLAQVIAATTTGLRQRRPRRIVRLAGLRA
ncbi:hypothetical protein, partial [Salmonella enterica]|uniref:hypothetical protein n=1 Tax=Salmonella enterica TaxID=28901 RepID=UPI001C3768A3